MKNLIQYTVTGLVLLAVVSCNNDFLKDTSENTSVGESTVFISPQWEAQDYLVYCATVGNAEYTIIDAPAWLDIDSKSGRFSNDVAAIHCHANVNSEFSEVGIYLAQMTLSVENKGNYIIPVNYITEGNPVIETEKNIKISYEPGNPSRLTVRNTGEGILLWEIKEYPKWMSINNDYLHSVNYPGTLLPQNAEGYTYFSFNPEASLPDDLTGKIVIVSNDKNNPETVIDVQCDLGDPSFRCYTDQLDFGRAETTLSLEISNQASGLLIWKIEDCPEWLSVSEPNGFLSSYSWKTVQFTCDRTKMSAGVNTATIHIKTNDKKNPVYSFSVIARSGSNNPENIKAIEGVITDAWFDNRTDILYLTTSQPNRLLAYDTKTKAVTRELGLSKAPTCFSVSEDGHKAVIGHGGLISYVDMDNFSVSKTLDANCNIFDIAWAVDDWSCYTEAGHYDVQWTNLYWINLNNENISRSSSNIYENCRIKKVPHQDYVIVSELNLSSGVYVFDSNSREEKNDIFISFRDFWFLNDGEFIISSSRNIYRTSSVLALSGYSSGGLSAIDMLKYDTSYDLSWIDYCTATNSLWVLPKKSYNETDNKILQFEANDYTPVGSYYYDDYYNGYPVQARYVFANGAGTELTVVRNTADGNTWSLEFIPVTQ
jgi:hypothetical protein